MKRIAPDISAIALTFNGPGRNYFAARLFNGREADELTDRHRLTGFFFEFSLSDLQRFFAFIFTLWNRPRREVFLRPERSTWMNKEDFQYSFISSKE